MRLGAVVREVWPRRRRIFRTSIDAEQRAQLGFVASGLGDSSRLDELELYASCEVVGVVRRLRVDPVNRTIEATISDGTGSLVAQLGIDRMQEVTGSLGRSVALRGVARLDRDGHATMLEPLIDLPPEVNGTESG